MQCRFRQRTYHAPRWEKTGAETGATYSQSMPNVPGYSRRSPKGGTHRVRPHWRAPTAREVEARIRRILRTLGLPVKTIRTQTTRPRSPEQLRVSSITKRAALESAIPLTPAAIVLTPVAGPGVLLFAAAAIAGTAYYHRRRARSVLELDPLEYSRDVWRRRRERVASAAKWFRRRTRKMKRAIGKRYLKARKRAGKEYGKRKAAAKAELKRQLWVVAYTFAPPLRWYHGQRAQGRRKALKRERAKNKAQAVALSDLYENIESRQGAINAEIAKGGRADAELLRQLKTEQSAELSEWLLVADNQTARARILASEQKALRRRESALKQAGWKPSRGKRPKGKSDKAPKPDGPSLKAQRAEVETLADTAFGIGGDDSFAILLDTLGLVSE